VRRVFLFDIDINQFVFRFTNCPVINVSTSQRLYISVCQDLAGAKRSEDGRLATNSCNLYQIGVTDLNEPFVGAFAKLRKSDY
jgi:hypothetical protein